MSISSCLFLSFSDNIHFSMFSVNCVDHNHSGFREIIDTLIIKGRSRQVTGMVAWSWKSDNPEKKHAGSKLRFWGWHEPGEMKN